MMYPYADFLIDFDNRHGAMLHHNCPENTRAAVIVETRPLFFLAKVIRNTMYFLGPRWNLHILCGDACLGYVQRCFGHWAVRVLRLAGAGRVDVPQYNRMLTSPDFWKLFSEDKLLIFQSDSLLASSNIEDFLAYDLVGAPCRTFDEQYIANGGLSLRSRSVMLDCLSRYSRPEGVPEDVFFTSAARSLGAALPDVITASCFAVESIYTRHPVGVHGTDKCYHSVEIAEKIVRAISY